jgi:hypothetical protein
MSFISSFDLLMMVLRLPQEKIAAKKPAISISCFFVKRCGMQMGSSLMKEEAVLKQNFKAASLFMEFPMLLNFLLFYRLL